MRILHVTECFDGGVSRAIEALVTLAPEHHHSLTYIGDETPSEQFVSSTRMPLNIPRALKHIRDEVKRLDIDIVHAHSSWAGVFTRVQKLKVPVIYEPHCYAFEMGSGLRSRFYFAAESLLARRTAVTVVLSEHERRLARRLRATSKTVFLPNVPSITEDELTALPPTWNRERTVVMVGRVTAQKDPEHFARLARTIYERDSSVGFRWVGAGSDDRSLHVLRDAGVEVTGWLGAADLAGELAKSGMYYHSARYEGFPLSVLDAARTGTPIVVRAIAPFEGTGLVSAHSINEAADKILAGLAETNIAESYVAAGTELLQKMNEATQRRALQELYQAGWR